MPAADQATCKREITIEVPPEVVHREAEKVAQAFQRQARVPGFRPGKAPLPLVRQRFRDKIREELLEHLVPEHLHQRIKDENLNLVGRPQVSDVTLDLEGAGPLQFKAVFEVLPQFELQDYSGLEVEAEEPVVIDEEVEAELKRLQEQNANFLPVEDRPLEEGDFALISFEGKPVGEGGQAPEGAAKPKAAPVKVEEVLCEIGGASTIPAFSENLRGASPGEERSFEVQYPADHNDTRLAGKTVLYTARVHGLKQKQVPDLNDDFARDLGEFSNIEDVRKHIRETLLENKKRRTEQEAKQRLLDRLVDLHDFPVPEIMVENETQSRMERTMRQLASQGVNPARLEVDWARLRASHREAAARSVKANFILDRIAGREGIEVSEEETEREIEQLVRQVRGKDPAAVRARLTKQGVAHTMKERVRSEKTLDFVYRRANRTASRAGSDSES